MNDWFFYYLIPGWGWDTFICVCADKCDALRVAAHERLGEVLRILRIILERYPALQSTELLVAAGSLIHQVKGILPFYFVQFFLFFIFSFLFL